MSNQQAASKAKKRWGKAFYVRNSGGMSSPDKRATALQTVQSARAAINHIDAEIARRLSELDWFQEFQKQKREHRAQLRKTEGGTMYYRFSVGKSHGIFTEILGQGDTWEEAFERADVADQRVLRRR